MPYLEERAGERRRGSPQVPSRPDIINNFRRRRGFCGTGFRKAADGKARFSETGNGRLGKFSIHGHNLFKFRDLQLAPPIFRAPARFSETRRA
jgi:hypothetical protein